MLRFFSITSLSLLTTTLLAAELDLKTALQEVQSDSPGIAASESQASEAKWKEREAMGKGFMPTLKANGNYLTNKKYQFINLNLGGGPVVFPTIFPNSQFNLMAELPIFDGFASTNRYQSAQKYADAAQEQLTWKKFQTEMSVTLQFYRALAAKLLRDVAQQNQKVLSEHKREAELFRKSGISTNYDVLRVEVQASNALTDLADAEDEIIIARQKLAEILGHDNEEREVTGELPAPNEQILSAAVSDSIGRSDIRALRLSAAARETEEKAGNRYWIPNLSLFANYNFYNNLSTGLDDWGSYRNSRQVGIMMNWNLFDGLVSYSQSKQSIERKVQAEKLLRTSELAASRDLEIWTRRYKSQCRIYQARMEDIKRSEESVRLAREGKKVGVRTDSELLDAELDLYRSKAGAVRAQLEAVESIISLQLAQGRRYFN
jgi:outer membrane protein TolC